MSDGGFHFSPVPKDLHDPEYIKALQKKLLAAHDLLEDIKNLIQDRPSILKNNKSYFKTKLVSRFDFENFCNKLSYRDGIMASLLYENDLKVDFVLNLKKNHIKELSLSKILKEKIEKYSKEIKKGDLIFFSSQEKLVQRAHLNQAFKRASDRAGISPHITPAMLLRYKEA